MGNVAIAEFLLAQGAPLEICTAAMLGRTSDVERLLRENPDLIHATGAHGIPLLTHAAFSGDLALFQSLAERGAQAGISAALYNAAGRGHAAIVSWCLEHGRPDVNWRDYQGQTALTVARRRNDERIVQLLQAAGATE
jgi:ankyrin repeat protein